MGRKKRKLVEATESEPTAVAKADPVPAPSSASISTSATAPNTAAVAVVEQENVEVKQEDEEKKTTPAASGYAMTSHSGDIVTEDIYVSDGSEDDDDVPLDQQPELLLGGSRMGVMRRGVGALRGALVQPNRQWARPSKDQHGDGDDDNDASGEQAEEDDLEKLDPAQRAARLLQEKQRKLEEAKVVARRLESEENAGRDPCLFSKRTAFDIRMDQIEDKPWTRGGEITDFFNYGLTEEDWLEYSSQQLAIRKELTEASQQKRSPDPTVVPVVPKTPTKQAPRVAVRSNSTTSTTSEMGSEGGETETRNEDGDVVVGPTRSAGEDNTAKDKKPGDGKDSSASGDVKHVGAGGAWGAGAAPGSLLAKLIEERDKKQDAKLSEPASADQQDDSSTKRGHDPTAYPERGYGSRGPGPEGYHHHRGGDFHHGEPQQYEPPPRPREYGRGYGGGYGYGGGRGRGGYGGRGRGGYHDQGGRGRGWPGGRGGYDPRARGGRGDYGGRRY